MVITCRFEQVVAVAQRHGILLEKYKPSMAAFSLLEESLPDIMAFQQPHKRAKGLKYIGLQGAHVQL